MFYALESPLRTRIEAFNGTAARLIVDAMPLRAR